MPGLYVVTGRKGWSVIHAATRMPLLDLAVCEEVEDEAWSDPQGLLRSPSPHQAWNPAQLPPRAPQPTPTHTEGRTLVR